MSSTSLMCLHGTSKFRNWELWISEKLNPLPFLVLLNSECFQCFQIPIWIWFFFFWFLRSDMQYARNNETSHTRETPQQYFVIKVNGSDSSSDPSWNEGILLLEMITLPWRHWAFPLTVANVWKFTPVLWRWNFTILTTNVCFLWEKWPKASPWGNCTSAHEKSSIHTGTHRGKTVWLSSASTCVKTAGTAWVLPNEAQVSGHIWE